MTKNKKQTVALRLLANGKVRKYENRRSSMFSQEPSLVTSALLNVLQPDYKNGEKVFIVFFRANTLARVLSHSGVIQREVVVPEEQANMLCDLYL